MPILQDPKTPIRFTPYEQMLLPEAERITYLLKPADIWSRANLRRMVSAKGGRRVGQMDVLLALREGVEQIFSASVSDRKAALLEQIDEAIAGLTDLSRKVMSGEYDPRTADGLQGLTTATRSQIAKLAALGEVSDVVMRASPRYAKLVADKETYELVRGFCSAQLFLVGWENGPAPFARGGTGVPDDLLLLLSDDHLVEIGAEVDRLLHPTETERKNSDSPSLGAETPAPSTAASSTTTTTL